MQGTQRHRALLEAGGEIVTATPRQARALATAFGRAAAARGEPVWETPRVACLAAWLERRMLALEDRPQLLGAEAAQRLWQLIVAASADADTLLGVEATAAEAARAWALATAWQVDPAAIRPATREEAAFVGWAREFERHTAARGVLDPARRAAWLAPRLAGTALPARLGLHGFGRLTPAERALATALGAAGCATEELALDGGPARLARLEAPTPEDEAAAIADWLATRLAADPRARLVVIVPDLAQRAAGLARRLDDRLAPELLAPGAPDARPYEFAMPASLAEQAVVATALGLLALARAEIDVLELGRLLRSPHLPATPAESAQRARVDAQLRRLPVPVLPTDHLATRLRSMREPEPAFAAIVEAVRAPLARRTRQGAADWADAMQRALRAAGWPKGRPLAPGEYQAARTLNESLATLGGLDPILPPLDLAGALAELRSLVAATRVPAEGAGAPVEILDRLDDPGLPCDGLWVAGLTADRFPATAQPSPFLPLALQRALGLPGATAEAALADARGALEGWRRATPELVLSAARADGDAERRPSPLLPAAPAPGGLTTVPSHAAQLKAARALEPWRDGSLPPWPAGARAGGGVRVLELMAQCPFQAAAELRLGAVALERPAVGLPRRLRGLLAHEALASLWQTLRSHAELAARGRDGRQAAVRAAVAAAFAAAARALPASRLVAVERDWLERAVGRLAEAELAREPFEVVACERSYRLAAAGVALEVRVDRIDRLADGAIVLIDYKAGTAAQRRWTGARPDPVQLPVYATLCEPAPVAVAFARLALAAEPFAGVAAREDVLPRVRALGAMRSRELRGLDWPALVAGWRSAVEGLAAGYAAGAAAVDPSDGACERCALAALCRISVPAVETAEAPEPAGGEDD